MNDIPFERPAKVLKWVIEKTGPKKFGFFLCIAWAIWTWRNKKVLGVEEINLQILVPTFLRMLEEYQCYAFRVLEIPMVDVSSSFDKWFPPPPEWLKVNTDAAVLRDLGVGFGWVALDHHGNVVEMGVKRIKVPWYAELAEVDAVRFALSHASMRGWNHVILESDAFDFIARLKSGSRGEAYVDVLLDDIRSLVPCFRSIKFSHVKRVGNTIAHLVARMSPLDGFKQIWSSSFPYAVILLANLDCQ